MKRKLKFLRERAETALPPSDAKNLFPKAALTAETVDAVFAPALALPKKEAAVEHLSALAGMERQEVRCGDQL